VLIDRLADALAAQAQVSSAADDGTHAIR
jgi:hypothetical protein